jgi:hypothetical protein
MLPNETECCGKPRNAGWSERYAQPVGGKKAIKARLASISMRELLSRTEPFHSVAV